MFSTINLATTAYNPDSAEQRELIRNQIKAVQEKYNVLLSADIHLAPGLIAATCWCFGQATGLALALFGGWQYVAYKNGAFSRNSLATEFQIELHKLLELYRWSGKNGPAVSRDDTFLAMLEMLAPFASTKDLLLWENGSVSQEDLSAKFMKILAEPPHQIQFVMAKNKKETGTLEWITRGYFFQAKKEVKKEDSRMEPVDNWRRPLAQMKYFLYGYQDPSAKSLLNQGMTFVRNTLGYK